MYSLIDNNDSIDPFKEKSEPVLFVGKSVKACVAWKTAFNHFFLILYFIFK